MPKLPPLPNLLNRKIYKTGQTRGADDDVIFQNRVGRNSTVLIPYEHYEGWKNPADNLGKYENGYIVLIKPEMYFQAKLFKNELESKGLKLGKNLLLLYETREQWNRFNPDKLKLSPATSRTSPLGGKYVARVPSTTSKDYEKILRGFTTSRMKGAGIRVYEYANSGTIHLCRLQLEFLYWCCKDAEVVTERAGMQSKDIKERKKTISNDAKRLGLDDIKVLQQSRILNQYNNLVCPLCIEPLSASGFFSRLSQSEGRDVPDLTVTQISLFHIEELKLGKFNHRIYNLGWGHHHCNVVTKDSGILETLKWMQEIIKINKKMGYKI